MSDGGTRLLANPLSRQSEGLIVEDNNERGSLTPKERARITELQDQLIVRFVHHRLAVAQGEEHQARALEMENRRPAAGEGRHQSTGRYGIGPASRFRRMTPRNVTPRAN